MKINDIDIHYEMVGKGEPLLLLHGFFGSSADWAPLVEALGAERQLLLVDLRGHGRSTNPSGQFTHRQCAADLLALTEALGLQRVDAIGMSAGADTLLHVATQRPERVRAMVLVSATTHFPEPARAIMRQVTTERHSDEEWRALRAVHHHGDEQIRSLWRIARGFADSYDDMNLTPVELATIRARTLIVSGDRDPLYPLDIPVAMYRAIPKSSLWIIPDCGHDPLFGARRRDFARMALSFLNAKA